MKNSNSPDQELQEAITKHIEQVLAASQAKPDDVLDGCPFQILFAADEEENVRITVRWPEDGNVSQSMKILTTMLHNITTGNWNKPLVDSINKHGVEAQQPQIANVILETWGNMAQKCADNKVCVSPRQVFARNQGGNLGQQG